MTIATIRLLDFTRQEKMVTARVRTGFGDPVVHFADDTIEVHDKKETGATGQRPPWDEVDYTPTSWIAARFAVSIVGGLVCLAAYVFVMAGYYLAAPVDLFLSDSYGEYLWRREFGREAVESRFRRR